MKTKRLPCSICGKSRPRYHGWARCRECQLALEIKRARELHGQPIQCKVCGEVKPRYQAKRSCRDCFQSAARSRYAKRSREEITCSKCGKLGIRHGTASWCRACASARRNVRGIMIVCTDCGKAAERFAHYRKCKACVEIGRRQRWKSTGRHQAAEARASKRVPRPTDTVYFVREIDTGWIKIGYTSQSIKLRLLGLQHGNPRDLEVMVVVPGSRLDEVRLHWRFEEHRIAREWFRPAPELLEYISTLEVQ